jgi:hypothetical protein
MNWLRSHPRLLPTLALSIALFSSGCGSDAPARLAAAERTKVEASLTDQVRAAEALPELPADCRRREASGVVEGDRLDVALVKSERALARQNARGGRCAGFYEDVRAGRER